MGLFFSMQISALCEQNSESLQTTFNEKMKKLTDFRFA